MKDQTIFSPVCRITCASQIILTRFLTAARLQSIQGGASTQFSMLPLNLGTQADVTDYVVTGAWSKKAYEEGQKFSKANLVAKGDNKSIPAPSTWKLSANSKYVHYCDNETIGGVEFKVFRLG